LPLIAKAPLGSGGTGNAFLRNVPAAKSMKMRRTTAACTSLVTRSPRVDNLGKGASGSTVQNMNIMLGFDEGTGLDG
jgi:N-acetyl-gamma-glutamylphosphate reductase